MKKNGTTKKYRPKNRSDHQSRRNLRKRGGGGGGDEAKKGELSFTPILSPIFYYSYNRLANNINDNYNGNKTEYTNEAINKYTSLAKSYYRINANVPTKQLRNSADEFLGFVLSGYYTGLPEARGMDTFEFGTEIAPPTKTKGISIKFQV